MMDYTTNEKSVWLAREVPSLDAINNLEITSIHGITFDFSYDECKLMRVLHLERLFPAYDAEEYDELKLIIKKYLDLNM